MSNHNEAYVADSVITPCAVGGSGATTTILGSNRVITNATSVGGVANSA